MFQRSQNCNRDISASSCLSSGPLPPDTRQSGHETKLINRRKKLATGFVHQVAQESVCSLPRWNWRSSLSVVLAPSSTPFSIAPSSFSGFPGVKFKERIKETCFGCWSKTTAESKTDWHHETDSPPPRPASQAELWGEISG